MWAGRGLFNLALQAAALLISEGLKTVVFVTRLISRQPKVGNRLGSQTNFGDRFEPKPRTKEILGKVHPSIFLIFFIMFNYYHTSFRPMSF